MQAVHFLEQALEASVSGLAHDALLASAEGVYRLLEDKEGAQELLQYVPQPNLRTELLSSESGLHPFLQRFRLNRLLYALGDQRLPAEIIPDPSQLREQGIVYFERALCVIAHIWAEAWCGRKLDGATIKLEVAPFLRLFNISWQETRDWTNWYRIQNAQSEFYELLVDAVAQHGRQATEALRIAVEREWDNVATSVHWSADIRRKIILALRYGGIHRNWVIEQLRILEEGMLEGCDVSGRIDACHKQAEAWLALGDQASARRLLGQMLRMSFGVGHRKELETWIQWLGPINAQEPERAAERIAWFARAAVALEATTEGEAARNAAHSLLAVAFRWSPRRAISLFQWFLKQRVIGHVEAISILLAEALKSPESPTVLVAFYWLTFCFPLLSKQILNWHPSSLEKLLLIMALSELLKQPATSLPRCVFTPCPL
jgi:hypothetical protein